MTHEKHCSRKGKKASYITTNPFRDGLFCYAFYLLLSDLSCVIISLFMKSLWCALCKGAYPWAFSVFMWKSHCLLHLALKRQVLVTKELILKLQEKSEQHEVERLGCQY